MSDSTPNPSRDEGRESSAETSAPRPSTLDSRLSRTPLLEARDVVKRFQLGEETKNVTDAYTGVLQPVRALTLPNAGYCAANSTPALVNTGKCDGNLSFPTTGDEAFVSVSNAEKPYRTWNVPALN